MEREWMKYLNPEEISLFSLQFANCDRIAKNDVVYMFDEVGSGKTISAGLMAMQCLWKSDLEGSRKNVLIITTPTLTISAKEKGKVKKGAFRRDWDGKREEQGKTVNVGKLTSVIRAMNWEHRIEECNNIGANLNKLIGNKYALIIVDEAHLFLPAENSKEIKKQLGALYSLTADKVVIATATPIKYSEENLREYAVMAHKIIHGKQENKYENAYVSGGREILMNEEVDFWERVNSETENMREVLNSYYADKEEDLCCCSFDVESPITRYFKDSISCLRAEEEKHKEKGIRAEAKVWRMDPTGASEEKQIAKKIKTCVYEKTGGKANRMIVFFRLKADVRRIGQALQEEGFMEYTGDCPKTNQKTYAIVMGDEGQIDAYAGVEKEPEEGSFGMRRYLPDVLLVTYQKMEQGVNLQEYNYVLNYYIPRAASSLEQRYGRVDRIDSTYPHIYMCYWLGKNRCSEINFYMAMFEYSNYLLASIPSRNILLSEAVLEVIQRAQEAEAFVKQYLGYLKMVEKNPSAYLEAMGQGDGYEGTNLDEDALQYLTELCEECKEEHPTEEEVLELIREQKKVLEMNKALGKEDRELLDQIVGMRKQCGDDIFYRKEFAGSNMADEIRSAETLRSISPIRCAEIIKETENYKTYEEHFRKDVKTAVVLKHYKELINLFLCQKMIEGKFCEMFPYEDAGAYTKENYSNREGLEEKRAWFYKQILLWAFDTEEFLRILNENKISKKDTEEEREIITEYLERAENNAYELVKQTSLFQGLLWFERMLCEETQYKRYPHNPIYRAYTRTVSRNMPVEVLSELFCLKAAETDEGLTVQASVFYKLVIILLGVEKTQELLYESEDMRTPRTRCVEYEEVGADGTTHRVTHTNLYDLPTEQRARINKQNAGYPVDDMLTYRIVRMHERSDCYGRYISTRIKDMRICSLERYEDIVDHVYTRALVQTEKYMPEFSENGSNVLYGYINWDAKRSGWAIAWQKAIKATVKHALEKEYGVDGIEADYISAMFADATIRYMSHEEYAGMSAREWNYILWNRISVLKDIGWIRRRWREEYLVKKKEGIRPAYLGIRERCPKEEGWNDLDGGTRKVLREYCELVEKGEAAVTDEKWLTECKSRKVSEDILRWPFWQGIYPWVMAIGIDESY